MQTCEKCGEDRAQTKSIQVETKGKQRRRAVICVDCWSGIHPGEWFVLDNEEVTCVYWECDACHNIFKASAIKVFIRPEQTPPWTEYLFCAQCASERPELKPMPAQEPEAAPVSQATPEVLAAAPEEKERQELGQEEAGPEQAIDSRLANMPGVKVVVGERAISYQRVKEGVMEVVQTVVDAAGEAYKRYVSREE